MLIVHERRGTFFFPFPLRPTANHLRTYEEAERRNLEFPLCMMNRKKAAAKVIIKNPQNYIKENEEKLMKNLRDRRWNEQSPVEVIFLRKYPISFARKLTPSPLPFSVIDFFAIIFYALPEKYFANPQQYFSFHLFS